MSKQIYEGIGLNQKEADGKLLKTASDNGIESNPSGVEYLCKIGEHSGKKNTDYSLAFASVLEQSGIKVEDYDPKTLQVTAFGTYEVAKAQRLPKASGASKSTRASPGLTDLF
jgi:hypothetical protein